MKKYPVSEWRPFQDIWQGLPSVFGQCFEFPLALGTESFYPAVDVYDDKDKVVVKAELPGINKDQVQLHVENGILTIRGEKKKETEVKKENYYHLESSCGSFQRTVELPGEVDKDKAKASYKNGILEITLPKKHGGREKSSRIKID